MIAEEELHKLLVEIKNHKRTMLKANRERIKIENEYKLKYAYNDWKKKEGLCFYVEGKKGEIFCCHVIKVTEELKQIEYIDLVNETYATDNITDPKEDCGYIRWTEISKEEYEKEKEEKTLLK